MIVKLLTSTQSILDMEDFAALAALTCHGNTDKDYVPADVLTRIITLGHESVLEHINLTFSVEGLSRACLQELSRHRHISLSVESTRHTLKRHLTKEKIRVTKYANDFFIQELGYSYAQLIIGILASVCNPSLCNADVSNDVLKYHIPEFWPTNLIITLNVREFRHILNLRTAPDALKEFQDLARSMFHEVPEQFRYLLQDCIHEEVSNGKSQS